VRAVELVGGARQEVAPHGLDVDELVGCEVDGVHERHRARLVGHGNRAGMSLTVPSALDAAPMASSMVRCWLSWRSRSSQSSCPVSGINRVAGARSALALEGSPRVDVRMVVELGDHDCRRRGPAAARWPGSRGR